MTGVIKSALETLHVIETDEEIAARAKADKEAAELLFKEAKVKENVAKAIHNEVDKLNKEFHDNATDAAINAAKAKEAAKTNQDILDKNQDVLDSINDAKVNGFTGEKVFIVPGQVVSNTSDNHGTHVIHTENDLVLPMHVSTEISIAS